MRRAIIGLIVTMGLVSAFARSAGAALPQITLSVQRAGIATWIDEPGAAGGSITYLSVRVFDTSTGQAADFVYQRGTSDGTTVTWDEIWLGFAQSADVRFIGNHAVEFSAAFRVFDCDDERCTTGFELPGLSTMTGTMVKTAGGEGSGYRFDVGGCHVDHVAGALVVHQATAHVVWDGVAYPQPSTDVMEASIEMARDVTVTVCLPEAG